MEPKIGFILLFIGIGAFAASLLAWFLVYPKRKRFLEQLKREFDFEYPRGILMFRSGKLKGIYRDHEITIAPFVIEGKLWILLKFFKPNDFLASVKIRKPGMFLTEPILKENRKVLFTGNSAFDSQFKIFGRLASPAGGPAPQINKIFSSQIQKKLTSLAKKQSFEIQILKDGIFYDSESKKNDLDLIKFISDLLIDLAVNIESGP